MVNWHSMWVFIYLWLIMQGMAAVLLLMVSSPIFSNQPSRTVPATHFPVMPIYPVYQPTIAPEPR